MQHHLCPQLRSTACYLQSVVCLASAQTAMVPDAPRFLAGQLKVIRELLGLLCPTVVCRRTLALMAVVHGVDRHSPRSHSIEASCSFAELAGYELPASSCFGTGFDPASSQSSMRNSCCSNSVLRRVKAQSSVPHTTWKTSRR